MSDRCQSCKAPIVWVVTATGHRIPLDPPVVEIVVGRGPASVTDDAGVTHRGTPTETAQPEMFAEVVRGRISHYATCPDADAWRGRSRG